MRVCKRGCDISRILIGYVLSDLHFDWLVGNMSLCQENLFKSKSEKTSIFLHLLNYLWEIFYKNNRKLFSCVCIAWYKHKRGWENSQQLYKPQTSSRVCITGSNSPNPSSVYIRLWKHGNHFLALKCLLSSVLDNQCVLWQERFEVISWNIVLRHFFWWWWKYTNTYQVVCSHCLSECMQSIYSFGEWN